MARLCSTTAWSSTRSTLIAAGFDPGMPSTKAHFRAPTVTCEDSGMARVLVTEEIAKGGLDRLRRAGHEVEVRLGLSPDELLDAVRGAHALIIRSATIVSAEVLDAGAELAVVGRAGIGLDNVDVEHATARGVM